ncbi:hypothetical protein NA57DRAFT_76277 [Rhizodiscina lignyota]|uniref:Uncharacterized protein n=1 Tax=Rhizodiscina lignyota TaxID=1504668 RepID=A0A9P4M965_9PEZI|nr:hypothetical protein NA57DRAFT_76277 [Rhizodiscina lignyota]
MPRHLTTQSKDNGDFPRRRWIGKALHWLKKLKRKKSDQNLKAGFTKPYDQPTTQPPQREDTDTSPFPPNASQASNLFERRQGDHFGHRGTTSMENAVTYMARQVAAGNERLAAALADATTGWSGRPYGPTNMGPSSCYGLLMQLHRDQSEVHRVEDDTYAPLTPAASAVSQRSVLERRQSGGSKG